MRDSICQCFPCGKTKKKASKPDSDEFDNAYLPRCHSQPDAYVIHTPGNNTPLHYTRAQVERKETFQDKPILRREIPSIKVTTSKYDEEYNMNHPRRGKALIFYHKNFVGKFNVEPRIGAQVDRETLREELEILGFDVLCYNDLKRNELLDTIATVQKEDHSDADCLVVTILTHGRKDYLLAQDEEYPISLIWSSFTANKCPTLAGKPKIFFIQACRGDDSDAGILMRCTRGKTMTDAVITSSAIPCYADFLITYSTVEGFQSFRTEGKGSWFMESICNELKERGTQLDLLTLMTRVARRVAVEYESYSSDEKLNEKKQIPSIVSMLIRKIYFRPKRRYSKHVSKVARKLDVDKNEECEGNRHSASSFSSKSDHRNVIDSQCVAQPNVNYDYEKLAAPGSSKRFSDTMCKEELKGTEPKTRKRSQSLFDATWFRLPFYDKRSSPTTLPRGEGKISTESPVCKDSDRYNMSHRQRGKAIIFNHEHFSPSLNPNNRIGTRVDRDNLTTQFKNLGFEVVCHDDLEYVEILNEIEKVQKEDHSNADCLVVVVLTHGVQSLLCSKDVAYTADKIWEPFTARNCPTLAGKPKIFFIQACRGDESDKGIFVNFSGGKTKTDSGPTDFTLPSYADILIAFSSFDGFEACRDEIEGSWFIQSICKELKEWGTRMDLLSLMTRVSRSVAIDYQDQQDNEPCRKKQIPSIVSMLTRDLYFEEKSTCTESD